MDIGAGAGDGADAVVICGTSGNICSWSRTGSEMIDGNSVSMGRDYGNHHGWVTVTFVNNRARASG